MCSILTKLVTKYKNRSSSAQTQQDNRHSRIRKAITTLVSVSNSPVVSRRRRRLPIELLLRCRRRFFFCICSIVSVPKNGHGPCPILHWLSHSRSYSRQVDHLFNQQITFAIVLVMLLAWAVLWMWISNVVSAACADGPTTLTTEACFGCNDYDLCLGATSASTCVDPECEAHTDCTYQCLPVDKSSAVLVVLVDFGSYKSDEELALGGYTKSDLAGYGDETSEWPSVSNDQVKALGRISVPPAVTTLYVDALCVIVAIGDMSHGVFDCLVLHQVDKRRWSIQKARSPVSSYRRI